MPFAPSSWTPMPPAVPLASTLQRSKSALVGVRLAGATTRALAGPGLHLHPEHDPHPWEPGHTPTGLMSPRAPAERGRPPVAP